jgi:hypothetical protein
MGSIELNLSISYLQQDQNHQRWSFLSPLNKSKLLVRQKKSGRLVSIGPDLPYLDQLKIANYR